ncbi:FAD-binding oxidoreductase [Aspergillus novofumigatus IBT 16806]|uniref:FAD binding domain protein n=1 Tax=Aspergillus novofumigatus (strain IBT 16806) TaxID=1392255 RepID=A0A2I1BVC7_ASPN1|nr:FAD binding domain protein [Aspergillus novofumigatus IBT 16806]PKX89314.1 FAD binding domain protein [Aspergillus novofumigatus IBT 16806]
MFLLVVFLLFASATSSLETSDIAAIFGPVLSPEAQIYFPADPDYNKQVKQRWSTFASPSYIATIKPATEQDVQNTVKAASQNGISFLATGGGHNTKVEFLKVRNVVNIDMSGLNSTELDTENNLLTVGSGTMNFQLYAELYKAGKELPIANPPCINVVGSTIGAGLGQLEGIHGLLIDSLLSVRLVTASGELITVSNDEHPDLFWAIRGAGANFGIVTSATYQVYNATNGGQVLNVDYEFPAAANRSLFEFLRSLDNERLESFVYVITLSYNQTIKEPSIIVTTEYQGPQEDVQPYIDRLVALNPTKWSNQTIPWDIMVTVNGFGEGTAVCIEGDHASTYHLGLATTDVSTFESAFEKYVSFSAKNPWYRGRLVIERYATEVAMAVPTSQWGVFPWRDIKTQLIFLNYFDDASHDDEVHAFIQPIRENFQKTSGFKEQHTYVNFAYGDEGPEVWYGAHNLPRLVELKQKWDPTNQFGPGAPVPLSL